MGQQPSCCGGREHRGSCYLCDPQVDTIRVDVASYRAKPNRTQEVWQQSLREAQLARERALSAATLPEDPDQVESEADKLEVAERSFVAPSKLMKAALDAKDGGPNRRQRRAAKSGARRESEREADERWRATRDEWERQVRATLEAEAEAKQRATEQGPAADADAEAEAALSPEEERLRALEMIRLEEAQRQAEEDAAQRACREDGNDDTSPGESNPVDADGLPQLVELAEGEGEAELTARGSPRGTEGLASDTAAKVAAFLSANNFQGGVNAGRKTMLRTTYPIHVAAAMGDAEIVRLLLQAGANLEQKNSAGQTAETIARKKNKKGTHSEVLDVLRGAAVRADAEDSLRQEKSER